MCNQNFAWFTIYTLIKQKNMDFVLSVNFFWKNKNQLVDTELNYKKVKSTLTANNKKGFILKNSDQIGNISHGSSCKCISSVKKLFFINKKERDKLVNV